MGRLFGGDGVRGIANAGLTCEAAMNIGRAAGARLAADTPHPLVLVGWDTRPSSEMLAAALAAGLCSVGAEVQLLGVVPTPAVACLTRAREAALGVAIAAAHTPCEYNGIKLFDKAGARAFAIEKDVEAILLDGAGEIPCPIGGDVGRITTAVRAAEEYRRHLASTVDNLRGMRLLVDCANGAAATVAEPLLSGLEANLILLNDTPNGVNINAQCGVAHAEALADAIKAHKCFGGIVLDGSGERCLLLDEKGNLLDGDRLLAALALDRKEKGTLPRDTVVTTPLANLGFFRFCEEHGLHAVTTDEGKTVAETLASQEWMLGGDPAGAVILREFAATADGLLTTIQLLALCREKGCKLSAVGEQMPRSPQVLITVKADDRQKAAYAADKALAAHVAALNASLATGRVTVRPSETEPLIRVMVEGRAFDEINQVAVTLADTIKQAIGAYAL